MCGIFGFSGKYPADVTKLRWLAVANESRGRHSFGVYSKKANKTLTESLVKDTGTATDNIEHPSFEDAFQGAVMFGGHTRAATVGSISKENSHPFSYDIEGGTLCIGAHNGFVMDDVGNNVNGDTIVQHEEFGFKTPFTVDSQLIFAMLSKEGGDYSQLSKLEGAIAIWFTLPNLHKDRLFLYKGQGRELNFGIAKEGIYFSSESTPLKLIGCKKIAPVPDNSVVILHEGLIEDVVNLGPSKIRIKLNAGRTTWQADLTKHERDRLGFKEVSSELPFTYKNKFNRAIDTTEYEYFPKPHVRSKKLDIDVEIDDYKDELGMLVADVKKEVHLYVNTPAQYVSQSSLSFDETDSALILIKLVASTKNNPPLPGWLIYDDVDDKICGVTTLVGVTVLRYASKLCNGTSRHLVLINPLGDEKYKFSYDITPEATRIMEVVLSIPFPQKDPSKTPGSPSDTPTNFDKTLCGFGKHRLDKLSEGSNKFSSILSYSRHHSAALQGPDVPVHTRSEIGETNELPKSPESGGINGSGSEEDNTGAYMGSGGLNARVKQKILPLLTPKYVDDLIGKECNTFLFKNRVLAYTHDPEYKFAKSQLILWMPAYADCVLALTNASILKLYHKSLGFDSFSILYYCKFLFSEMAENYIIGVEKKVYEEYKRMLHEIKESAKSLGKAPTGMEVSAEKKLIHLCTLEELHNIIGPKRLTD